MKLPKDSILLIDGHALLYRSFHALPPLTTKQGIQTNAIYGFITTLFKALEDSKPAYWAIAFDLAGPTFRHKAYEGYKASRPDTPPELSSQIPYAYQVADALNIPVFTKEGYEADDIIGTLATQAKKQGVPVLILTGDRDAFQLVNDSTFVYTMKRSITETAVYDAEAVRARMGVDPIQIPDFKALAGDSSDEIPGIDGIGEKTAAVILQTAKDIPHLYTLMAQGGDLPGVTPRIRQKIIDGEAIAKQSRELATIDCNVPVDLNLEACVLHDYDAEKATQVFQELEFFSLIKRLPKLEGVKATPQTEKRDWRHTVLTTEQAIKEAITALQEEKVLSVDTETDNLDGPIIGISLAAKENMGYYVPCIPEHGAILSKETIGDLFRPLLEDKAIAKVGHNLKYDRAALRQLGITLAPISFDTMIAAYVLHAHLRTFDLDTVAQRELGYTMIPFHAVAGSNKKTIDVLSMDPEKLAAYAAEDAIITFRLYEHFATDLAKLPKLRHVAETIDFPLVEVLSDMEMHGICLNREILTTLGKELDKEIRSLKEAISSYAKGDININSPAQLQKLLFEDLGLEKKGVKATQSGLSTAASELEKLQGLHPIIEKILRYRELTKLQSTYIQTLPDLVDAEGRIHTQFSQTTAATGRLASSSPNLQNIPIRTELGNKIRTAFRAPEGYSLVSLDYSQIELRIIAHLSDDPHLQQVFRDGRDIHDEVAKRLEIDRRAAKAINFGIIYGLSAYGLGQALKIDPKVAKQYIDAYFASYPGVAHYLEETKQLIRSQGYVETLFGRRREIPEIHAANAVVRAAAERMAINAPAQGTASDIMKLAMIMAHAWLEHTYHESKKRPYLVLQVHDELLLEVPDDEIETVSRHVKKIMEEIHPLSVPLVADCAVGKTWGKTEEMALTVE